jgi:hypothetical protein
MRVIEIIETIEHMNKIVKRKKDLIDEIAKNIIKKPRSRSEYSYSVSEPREVFVSLLDVNKIR